MSFPVCLERSGTGGHEHRHTVGSEAMSSTARCSPCCSRGISTPPVVAESLPWSNRCCGLRSTDGLHTTVGGVLGRSLQRGSGSNVDIEAPSNNSGGPSTAKSQAMSVSTRLSGLPCRFSVKGHGVWPVGNVPLRWSVDVGRLCCVGAETCEGLSKTAPSRRVTKTTSLDVGFIFAASSASWSRSSRGRGNMSTVEARREDR